MRCVEHSELFPQPANVSSVMRPSVFASWWLWKLGFYPPTETGRYRYMGIIFLDDYISGDAHRFSNKILFGTKTDKRVLKRFTYISKEQRKKLKWQVF